MQYRIRNGDQLIATISSKSYHIAGLTPNTSYNFTVTAFNGLRESSKASATVKTRGLRVNVPLRLNVGDTCNLIYEEYALGLVPIGTEPAGMFGGGNKQVIPVKVVSTGATSTVEVANAFNLMSDDLTMKQLEDGSFAVFDNYKALYFKQ